MSIAAYLTITLNKINLLLTIIDFDRNLNNISKTKIHSYCKIIIFGTFVFYI